MQPTRIRSSGVDSEITLGNLSVTGNTVLGNTFVGNLFYANGAVFVSGSASAAGVGQPAVIQQIARLEEKYSNNQYQNYLTGGSWGTRRLNFIRYDPNSIVSDLTSYRFTLGPGTYYFTFSAFALKVGIHLVRIQNITDNTIVGYGIPVWSDNTATDVGMLADGRARVVITDTKQFELQHYIATTSTGIWGNGHAAAIGLDEIYSTVEIYKETVAVGYTGSIGSSGGTGFTGSAGFTGSTGSGFVGSAGAVGFTGSNGSAGSTGFTGSQGTGYTGSQGLIGYTGSAGSGGSGNGYTGSQGDPYLVAIGDTPPNSPVTGTLWWDSSYGSLFFYYTDSDSSQWVNAIGGGGGIGLSTRTTANVTTSNIANNVTANVAITGFKGYNLYKIYASHPAWIRLYTSNSARTADSARSQGADPTPDTGVVAEVITSNIAQTVVLSPAVAGFNDESPVTTTIPVAVTNLSGGANVITISVTVLQTEA